MLGEGARAEFGLGSGSCSGGEEDSVEGEKKVQRVREALVWALGTLARSLFGSRSSNDMLVCNRNE